MRAPLVQGYLLHRPMPLAALLPVVRANRRDCGRPLDGTAPPTDAGELLAPIA